MRWATKSGTYGGKLYEPNIRLGQNDIANVERRDDPLLEQNLPGESVLERVKDLHQRERNLKCFMLPY